MTAIGPVEYSGFINQPSDIVKVGGQDFQRIHQQQLADLVRRQEQEKKDETKPVDNSDDVKIVTDNESSNRQNLEQNKNAQTEEPETPPVEHYEEVNYDDPDLGHNLDWQS